MTEQTNIIHEGGDSYRPIVIIEINNLALWPNANIAYFKSSGRTNKTPQYSNTWLPFGGLVEENNTIIRNNTFDKGHLIKMSDLLSISTYFRWKSTLLMNYFRTKDNFHPFIDVFYESPRGTMKNVTTTEITHFREAEEIRTLFDSYFLFDWQLRISAQIGGGYWERNRDFHEYVLAHIELPVSVIIPVLPDYLHFSTEQELAQHVKGDEPTEGQTYSNNKNYIIAFLRQHESQVIYDNTVHNFFTRFTNDNPKSDEDIINQHNYDPAILMRGYYVMNELIRVDKMMTDRFKGTPRKSTREDNNAPPPPAPAPAPAPAPKEKRKFSEVNEDKDVGGTMKRQGKRKGTKKRRKGTKKRRKCTKKRRNSNKRMK